MFYYHKYKYIISFINLNLLILLLQIPFIFIFSRSIIEDPFYIFYIFKNFNIVSNREIPLNDKYSQTKENLQNIITNLKGKQMKNTYRKEFKKKNQSINQYQIKANEPKNNINYLLLITKAYQKEKNKLYIEFIDLHLLDQQYQQEIKKQQTDKQFTGHQKLGNILSGVKNFKTQINQLPVKISFQFILRTGIICQETHGIIHKNQIKIKLESCKES
ncbi:transmembrane protein, putative (macronuclear) [Tetrahymena thermophila SB210]|uniref:Transmembrane protein, putative n=1 Tax=Tetrahymena thermophila (strain SB210) TaxID=312017 RepID=W7XC27_TETTS|nr:transmembrane protein, putative [Tetrahymena thermophila SB210]EWS74912.1 transmembrane protein, putative [Tetrahymena thermophila SB210]|eukprot:XP_012652625.1 transmembrane protein, putative [Tetrahymena thermophila SB210]